MLQSRKRGRALFGMAVVGLFMVTFFMHDRRHPDPRLILHTNVGDLTLRLHASRAPRTVAQVVRLANGGAYDTDSICYVAHGFVAQIGGFRQRRLPLTDQQQRMISRIPPEFDNGLRHRRGALTLTRDKNDPTSGIGSFCIMLGAAPDMDGNNTVFGEVERGWDVLAKIENAPLKVDGHTPDGRLEIAHVEVTYAPPPPLQPPDPPEPSAQAPECHTGLHTPEAVAARSTTDTAQVTESRDADGQHVKTFEFKNILVDKIYPSMLGPWKNQTIVVGDARDKYVWITSYRAEVLDGKDGSASQEFMCHTNLSTTSSRPLLSVSQGQKEVAFPPGFALRVASASDRQMRLIVQVLNNNYPRIHRQLTFKTTIRYYGDAEARKLHLIPLRQEAVATEAYTEPRELRAGEIAVRPCGEARTYKVDGRTVCGHWMVPPGRQVIPYNVTRQLRLSKNTTAHYIWMHAHPYAESMELRDDTTHHTVWKGNAANAADPERAQITSSDSYCDARGLPLAAGHKYTFISTYNNRSKHDVDAMASMWLFVRDD